MSNKNKRESPLVKAVVALDNYLSELERVGTKINSTDMAADFDVEYIQKLMTRFAECGQGVSEEVAQLSTELQEARARAEAVAEGVSRQAELFYKRREEQNKELEKVRVLSERIQHLTAAISDSAKTPSDLPAFESQLAGLIEELQQLRQSARNSRMKALEKNAESLAQKLQAVQKRLRDQSHS